MFPADFDLSKAIALGLIFILWASYSPIMRMLGRGTLNTQLHGVRIRWMRNLISEKREKRVVDGILLGQISGAMSFFGSATLIVLAGLVGTLASINKVHSVIQEIPFFPNVSLPLFTIYFGTLTVIIAFSFFSFTYALRKLAYTLAMIGALSEAPAERPEDKIMIDQTATVLTEALRSLNAGIRGFYFAVAALLLYAGPLISIPATLFIAFMIYYRQGLSTEALAIERYVEAMSRLDK